MTCTEIEELSGAYVLDAVTAEERELIEVHLNQCPQCVQSIRELRATMDLLPLSVSQVSPPPQLKGRILSAVQAVASASAQETLSVPVARSLHPVPNLMPVAQQETRRPTMPSRRRAATRWAMPLLAAAAVLFLLLSGSLASWNFSLQHQVTALQSQVSSTQANAVAVTTYAIKGTPAAPTVTGEATHYSGKNIDVTIMTLRGLPALQNQQVYQGWEIQGKQTKSVGLLNAQANGTATININGDVKGNDAVAVSLENGPQATPDAPKGKVLAVGKVS